MDAQAVRAAAGDVAGVFYGELRRFDDGEFEKYIVFPSFNMLQRYLESLNYDVSVMESSALAAAQTHYVSQSDVSRLSIKKNAQVLMINPSLKTVRRLIQQLNSISKLHLA